LYYTNTSTTTGNVYGSFSIEDPTLNSAGTKNNITLEYNASGASAVGQFEDIGGTADIYAYYANYGSDSTTNFIAREGITTPKTRDYYTLWGTYVDSIGQTLLSLRAPQEQLFGEYIVGTQAEMEGTPVSANAGETVSLLGGQVKIEGSVGGLTKATLPSSIAKLDTAVTAADKSGYNLVLVGGPAVNTLVNDLQTTGKLTKTIGAVGSDADVAAAGAGVIELVADAFATGKYAVVVAGSDRAGTAKAAAVLAKDSSATLAGKTVYEV